MALDLEATLPGVLFELLCRSPWKYIGVFKDLWQAQWHAAAAVNLSNMRLTEVVVFAQWNLADLRCCYFPSTLESQF